MEYRKRFGFVLAASFFLFLNAQNAAGQTVDLTGNLWNISAEDAGGLTWDESILVFTHQAPVPGTSYSELSGYFDWAGSNGAYGRELFTGTFFSDLTIDLMGFQLIDSSGIVTGRYFAEVAPDGNSIIRGNWTGAGFPSDDWSAVRGISGDLFRDSFEDP